LILRHQRAGLQRRQPRRPHLTWTAQQARNLLRELGEQAEHVKFMIRDRGFNFTTAFDAVRADAPTSRTGPARPMKLVSAAGKPCRAPAAVTGPDSPTAVP
jgi:hypothetical protein